MNIIEKWRAENIIERRIISFDFQNVIGILVWEGRWNKERERERERERVVLKSLMFGFRLCNDVFCLNVFAFDNW